MYKYIIPIIFILYFILFFCVNDKKNFIKFTIILLLLIEILKSNNRSENFDVDLYNIQQLQCTKPLLPSDYQFSKFYVDNSYFVNFKCKHNGVEYYLACVKNSDCINEQKQTIDCSHYSVILLNATDAITLNKKYLDDLEHQVAVCNFTNQSKCLLDNKKLTKQEESNVCHSTFPECVQKKQFITDFNVIKNIQPNGSNTYNFVGTATPYLNNEILQTTLNQSLVNLQGVDLMCGDFLKNNVNTNITLFEKNANGDLTNIIGNMEGLINVYISFQTQIINAITDPTTQVRTLKPLTNSDGLPIISTNYLCWSPIKCKYNEKTYNRIGLNSNINDKTVLQFTPILVKK
jgi:hypothetical protein